MKRHLLRLSALWLLLVAAVTAQAQEVTYPITANWSWQDGIPATISSVAIEGRTDNVASDVEGIQMVVDATNGKLSSNGNNAQFNAGTKLQIPVGSTADVVTVHSHEYNFVSIKVGGTVYTDQTVEYTATATDVKAGYVEIEAPAHMYLYYVKVVQNEPGGDVPGDEPSVEPGVTTYPLTATWDYGNATVMAETMALSGTNTAGKVNAVENNGIVLTVNANGASFRENGNNIQVQSGAEFCVPVHSSNDIITIKGYPSYSYYSINGGEEIKNTNDNPQTEYKVKGSDVTRGYVVIKSTNDNNYFYSITVVQQEEAGPATLDNEAVTATFPFNLGTEGQKATFSGDYFLSSKVSLGSNLSIKDKNAGGGFDQTRVEPQAKETAAGATNLIQFMITPKPGFTFTPAKVSLKSTRFGTNGGKLDIAWQNADGTTKSLATNILPNRNDGTKPAIAEEEGQKFSALSYDVTGATPGEGACGLAINLYSLDPGKSVGFADVIIEGTLSGTEKDVPVLASFKINGTEYTVEDVFGEQYEATLKLSKKEAMVSASNPLTDLTAASGEIGTVAYQATETSCAVTIPMTAGSTQMDYVLSIVQKPDYTLSYIGADGKTLTTQTIEEDGTIGEFAYDIADVKATKDGYKARGWFKQDYVGEKFTSESVITGNTSLYAIETEIETPSESRKYVFDLTSTTFYDEDHEGFNSIGNGVWHDKQHGWVFNNGDKIELLVGTKATINFSLCAYSGGSATIEASNGQTINSKVDNDGASGSINYEGEAGTLTLNITGTTYIHNITVFNTAEANYEKQGDWLIVKKDDASSLLDAIEVAKGIENAKIFLPNGTYDLGNTVQTEISGTNVSLIGQSAEKTIIVTRPIEEGLGKADLLLNTGTGLYMQNLSLKNDYSYGGNDGRAASLHDKGTKTIAKDIFLLSHQDTYWSNKVGGLYYFEGGELHGTVDYLCGDGRAYFNSCKIVNEVRGSATITANSELYVFNNCTVENNATTYNFGRAWSNNPVCIFLNTTLLDPSRLVAKRWLETGINCDYTKAGEYGTKNAAGENITPSTNVVTFKKANTTIETILSADEAATYSIDYVLGDWAAIAQQQAKQLEAPAATYANGKVSWTPANNGAIAYLLEKNGEFVAITTESSYDIEIGDADKLTIRAANARGGFGEAAEVAKKATSVTNVKTAAASDAIYTLQGVRVDKATRGLYIKGGKTIFVK